MSLEQQYKTIAAMFVRNQGLKRALRYAASEIKRLRKIGNDEGADGWVEILREIEAIKKAAGV